MTGQEARDFLRREPAGHREPGLSLMRGLMTRLGNPQESLRFVHVAGTNGKGSVCAMLASVFEAAGYRTGLYTSPHLSDYPERFRINGAEIPEAELVRLAARVEAACAGLPAEPGPFEKLTALGFLWFAEQGCELVVLEVGLGGRFDATNIISRPEAAVIAQLGLEHTAILGSTLAAIAGEKAGILKAGCPAVLLRQEEETMAVVRDRAAGLGCPLSLADPAAVRVTERSLHGQRLDYGMYRSLLLALNGSYQQKNAVLVLETVDMLRRQGLRLPEQAVREGLASVRWPARLELLAEEPPVLLDGAHNPSGMRELAVSLRELLPDRPLQLVLGILKDKDLSAMLAALPDGVVSVTAVSPPTPRALPAETLAEAVRRQTGLPARAAALPDALSAAQAGAAPDGGVVIAGSLYLAGPVRTYFGR